MQAVRLRHTANGTCQHLPEIVFVLQRGTLDYMPPEMFGCYDEDGEGPGKQAVTQAVDVYSFGLVLWQIVTGGCLDKMQGSLRPPRCLPLPLWCGCISCV